MGEDGRGLAVSGVGAGTDVGRCRDLNEDAFVVGSGLFAVADGMGGHAAGDVASRLTVEALQRADRRDMDESSIRRAVAAANQAVVDHVAAHPERDGMGCTVAGACLMTGPGPAHWVVFHLGDSRVYALDDQGLRRLTTDHSEVQELVDAGMVDAASARSHPRRNVITRAVGEVPPAPLDVRLVPARPGQRLLVTTDGLTSELEDGQIAELLHGRDDPQAAVDRLLAEALAAGGRDNVTLLVVDLDAATADDVGTTLPRGLIQREAVS